MGDSFFFFSIHEIGGQAGIATGKSLRGSSSGYTSSRRRKRRHFHLRLALLLVGLCLASFLLTQGYLWRTPIWNGEAGHRAAILDELSMTDPNPSFLQNVTQSLRPSGYSVDYYSPDQVTVDLFRDLPNRNYGLIIIRSHTASSAGIITGEPYSQGKYVYEQLTDHLVQGLIQSRPSYFAVEPGFVSSEMHGRFPDSTVILMGCAGLQGNPELAQAFVDKGARFFVGWTDTVTARSTDLATAVFINGVAKGMTVEKAVGLAANYPDTLYNSHLSYLSWNQVSGVRINNTLDALANWVPLVVMLVFGPALVILIPKILTRR